MATRVTDGARRERLRRSRARALLSLNLKKNRDCSLSTSHLERSLNSVEVLEKFLISLLGLQKSLKFTTFSNQTPFSVKLDYFAEKNLPHLPPAIIASILAKFEPK